ncbi:unnamed protein product, partial [Diplocarpon coronariae]
ERRTANGQYTIGEDNSLAIDQPGTIAHDDSRRLSVVEDAYDGKPTTEELGSLRRVPGEIPIAAYGLCFA